MCSKLAPWALPCLLLLPCMQSPADAADVQCSVSTRETYVNLPFTLQIQINNAKSQGTPVIPPVDGLEIVANGPPSRSYRTTIINGRTTMIRAAHAALESGNSSLIGEVLPQSLGQ